MVADEVKQKFFEDNEDFHEVKGDPANATIGDISSIDEIGDDVWLMQCPSGFDVSTLKGEKMKLPGRTTVHTSANEIEALSVEFEKPEKHAFGYINRKGRYGLRLLPVSGAIVVRNKLTANTHLNAEQIQEVAKCKSLIPKKPLIKVRHPLLGSMFQEELKKVRPRTAERLKEADSMSMQVMREARQKANALKRPRTGGDNAASTTAKDNDVDIKAEDSDDVQFVSRTEPSKKKKKSKRSKHDAEVVSEDLQWIKEL